MKKLLFTLVGAAAFAALAADPTQQDARTGDISWVGFENYSLGPVVGIGDDGSSGGSLWSCAGDDASLVKTYNGDNAAEPTGVSFPAPFPDAGDKYLALDTNGSELQRAIPSDQDQNVVPATGTYIDTLVQFTPSESAPTSGDLDGAKLAIWLGVVEGATNLYVQGNSWDINEGFLGTSQAFALSGKTIEPGTWYRLTVKAIPNVLGGDTGSCIPAFQIYVDGTEMTLTTSPFSAGMLTALSEYGAAAYASSDIQAAVVANKLVPSIQAEIGTYGDTVTLNSVGFKGTGALDDFVVTTEAPSFTPAGIDFTLTWPSGVTPVSYKVGDGAAVAIDGSTTFPISVPDGALVAFTFTNADGATKTMTATASSSVNSIDASTAVYTWADYLGEAVDGAYTIDDANDLDMLRKGVANTNDLTTVGVTFKQTANIDMTSAGAFAGIGAVGAENATTLTMTAFEGTYDGGNYTISNITFTNRKGSGLFNLIRGATIKDLVVDTVSYEAPFAAAKLGGAMVVGNGVNCTLQHIVTLGSNGLGNPSTYNAAGIANRLEGRGGPVLVIGCTNSAAIYGCYSKIGGICPIVQGDTQPVAFVDCANTGNIVAYGTEAQTNLSGKVPGVDGAAGILAYTQGGANLLSFTNCVNTGTITPFSSSTKVASILGYTVVAGITAVGGSAQADIKSVNTGADKVSGLKFATVDNGVATFVADDALVLDGSYKVMSGNAAYAFASAGSITFDESLVSPTVTADAAYLLSQSGSGTVTYTAALAVAEITGGAKYATLQAAVDAATAGDTVTVLADCTISTSLSIAKNLTIHNDYTITGAVDYAICIGATVSFEGSGKLERASGISGSAFCVGANETTRGAITAGTAGTLNFTGMTVCGGSGGNLIKLENGTVTMNGGVLKDGKRGIKADADKGSYTSTIVINGGTITNNTDCAVMASAESETGTATVTINGGVISGALDNNEGKAAQKGTHTITIPGTSTAMFDADQSTFCESGYETKDGDSDGWYTVAAVQSAGWVDDSSTITAGTKASEQYSALAGTALADADAKELTDWAKAKSIDFSAAVANAGDYVEAFLLNCAVADVENEKDAFVLNITIGADGTPSVALPAGKDYNGKLQMKGSTDLNTWTDVESASKNYQFYKYILSL